MSKRIIELPDKVVQAIQNGEDYRYDIHTAIAQSIPYNPTGDCISREALRKAFHERIWYFDKSSWDEANALIDNAPTVEYTFEEAFQKTVCEQRLYCPKRPQGEWIIVKDEKYGDNVKCPFCDKELAGTDLNFCCKCGADMRRGGAE